jgi:NitT/TauT family transport system substrate-binding protein
MPKVPYPTMKGIQMVLDEIGARTPKVKSLPPSSFVDVTFLRELEKSGFIKNLYGE